MKVINVCAVMTTFNPSFRVVENLSRIVSQVGVVVVVNDFGEPVEIIEKLKNKTVYVLNNEENLGIAKSLNRGVSFAKKLGFKYILTVDDDSLFEDDYVSKLYSKLLDLGDAACLVGGMYDSVNPRKDLSKKIVLITSGSLFRVKDFDSIDGFNEKLFIDYVDFDFCLRMSKKTNSNIYEVGVASFSHQIGEVFERANKSRFISSFNHAPFRIYYQSRNLIYMIKSFLFFKPIFIIYLSRNLFALPIKVLIYDSDKSKKMYFFFKGLKDGFKSNFGRLDD